ncbi:MAG: glycosyltransferase family 39 protein, partial [Acidimicrobiales bacterium]|nr:glycosyltransferase family 39 protein [Acidimicrobiales bacterium]
MPQRLRSFPALLVAIVGLALAVRVLATLVGYQNLPLGLDDNNWYHTQSLLLADHGDLYDPFACLDSVREEGMGNDQAVALCRERGVLEPSAGHPPLYLVYLAGVARLGFESVLAQRLASCLLGALAVGLVGLVGRQVAGRRAGLLAALLAAVYPNLWINDGLILAEPLYTVAVGAFLALCYRLWRSPSWGTAALLGLVVGLAALTRSEGLTLLPFVVLPLAVVLPGVSWGRKAGLAALVGVVAVAVTAPWVAHNLGRFSEPVYLASGTGRVMAYGNCDATYYGDKLGYWDDSCTLKVFPDGDESVVDAAHRELATDYMSENAGRLPVVVAARIGRMWSVYAPIQGANLDILFERRGA